MFDAYKVDQGKNIFNYLLNSYMNEQFKSLLVNILKYIGIIKMRSLIEHDSSKHIKNLSLSHHLRNLSCVLKYPLPDIANSGIAIYDSFLIEEPSPLQPSSYHKLENIKTLLLREKETFDSSLQILTKKRLPKSCKYSSESDLTKVSTKHYQSFSTSKKRNNSHFHWNSKQLIKVYGMRYNRSVRNQVRSKSPKPRLSLMTPNKALRR